MMPRPTTLLLQWTAAAGALISAWLVLGGPLGAAAAEPADADALENIALGRPYTLEPAPSYALSADPGDATHHLTDGETTADYFWTQPGTVGWQNVAYAAITVDLGGVEPIGGVSLNTAAGRAQVTWPAAVLILVSEDGEEYRLVGDLVALDHAVRGPWPEDYAIRRLKTTALSARGRFVRFVIVPPAGGLYVFTDEVEVFRGDPALQELEPGGEVVDDLNRLAARQRVYGAVRRRFADDAEGIRRAVAAAEVDEAARGRLSAELDAVAARLEADTEVIRAAAADPGFRAVLPLSRDHGALFAVLGKLWGETGQGPLDAFAANPWDPLDPYAAPEGLPEVDVHLMQGESRAGAVNLFAAGAEPLDVRIRFEGIEGGAVPPWVTVCEVPWTDTNRAVPVTAALPEARRIDDGWQLSVDAGLVRQVWFTFHGAHLAAGQHEGAMVVEADGLPPRRVPLHVTVYPVDFPERTTLLLGGWSYTDRDLRPGVLDHLQDRFVNAPWAGAGVLFSCRFGDEPQSVELDTRALDAWLDDWPDAARYHVYLAVADYSGPMRRTLGGIAAGEAGFDARVGAWISAWVDHLRSRGIGPERLALLIHDEPHEGTDVGLLLAWAGAIRAAEPEVILWLDPVYRDPASAPPEVYDSSDVLCPNRTMWLADRAAFEEVFLDQQAEGKALEFYSCSGPARLLDPYSYYRLQAWDCWRYGAGGSYFWSFQGRGATWNEYLSRGGGPYTPFFIDGSTVVAGKQMEAVRESVQDYETLLMLRRAVEEAREAGREGTALEAAEALLDRAAAEVLDAPAADRIHWHEPKDRSTADRVRRRLLEALTALAAGE